jgi:hypothetical protein
MRFLFPWLGRARYALLCGKWGERAEGSAEEKEKDALF